MNMKRIVSRGIPLLLTAVFLTTCTNPFFESLLGLKEKGGTTTITVVRNAGEQTTYTSTGDGIMFNMVYVPLVHSFPTGSNDDGTAAVSTAYEIGETAVTYELWHAVRAWAEPKGYAFHNNPGQEGSLPTSQNTTPGDTPGSDKDEPVTMVTWFDTVVWLNALTEWVNEKTGSSLTPVYYYESACTTVAKNSDHAANFEKEDALYTYRSAYEKAGTTGFRLPTSNEWELAARWRGDDTTNVVNTAPFTTAPWFTKGNSASGATKSYDDADAEPTKAVAWYNANALGKTQVVKGRTANGLGVYDMSGNVVEWCYDWYPMYMGSCRILRGGACNTNANDLQVGYLLVDVPGVRTSVLGFRPARTAQ
jgi:formylglycine-generating enzyme required for sulfatase activity